MIQLHGGGPQLTRHPVSIIGGGGHEGGQAGGHEGGH